MVILIQHLFHPPQIQFGWRQPVIQIANPEDLVVVFDRFGRERRGEYQPVANVQVILIPALYLFHMSR